MDDADSTEHPTPVSKDAPKEEVLMESQVSINLEVAPGTRLRVSLNAHTPDGTLLEQRTVVLENPIPVDGLQESNQRNPSAVSRKPSWLPSRAGWSGLLLAVTIGIYLLTRLIGLEKFPIYFFTDEAVQTVTAADLLRDQFHGENGEFLPTFFRNGGQFNLGLSVYLQIIPTAMFGKTIFVTRAVSALVSLLAVLAVGLVLRNNFNSRSAWAGSMLLTLTPAWFLHSRTAFETVLAVSFYAAFIYCYLQYRQGRSSFLYASVGFAALTFYSYSPGQMVIGVTALLLFITDWRYHWQQRKFILRGLVVAAVLAIPYLRFQLNHPGETLRHLQILDSYWVQELTVVEKLGRYIQEYLQGLNPLYWFDPIPDGLARHIVKDQGYLWIPAAPFVILGFILSVLRVRKPEYRVVLISLLAAPTGSALVGIGITRLLFMVVPAALLGGIGFSTIVDWMTSRGSRPDKSQTVRLMLTLCTFVVLVIASFMMLNDALVNGPTWFDDYGLGGMQFGGKVLFEDLRTYLAKNPDARVTLSPSWANGTDVIARFFFDDPIPFNLGTIEGYLQQYIPIDPAEVFILLPEELQQVRESGKFQIVEIFRTVDYPNGQPGFYYTTLVYRNDAERIFALEKEQRRKLVQEEITLADGQKAVVSYSHLDMGKINEAFDGDPASLIRTLEANPFKINLFFQEPRALNGLRLRIGGVPTQVTVLVYVNGENLPRNFTVNAGESPSPQFINVDFHQPRQVTSMQIEILNIRDMEPAHVHLWEIQLR